MTATMPDIDQLEHLDFEPACQAFICLADRPPATDVVTLRCGCIVLHCPDCVDLTYRIIRMDLWTPKATCHHCGHVFYQIRFSHLYVSIRPL